MDAGQSVWIRSIAQALLPASDPVLQPTSGGSSSTVWRVDAGKERYALRVRPLCELDAVEREAAGMRGGREAGIPAPEVLRIQAVGEWACLLTTWCPGQTLVEALRSGSDPDLLGCACGRLQARLNLAPPPPGFAPGDGWLRTTREEDAVLAPVRDGMALRLLHLDFHPLNILVDGHVATGVVDWVNASAGDPRQDLARSLAVLRLVLEREPVPGDSSAVVAALDRAWLRGYEEVAGHPAALDRFLVWAGLRTVRDLAGKVSPTTLDAMRAAVDAWAACLAD